MDKQKLKKIATPVLVILGFIILGFGINKYNKIRSYDNLITEANKYMDSDEYDKAIALFKQSLDYKNDPNVERSIKLAGNLKTAKSIYDNGVSLMNNKDYEGAIQQFQKITQEDDKLYSAAQKKITECKKNFISQNIELANNDIKNNKYDEASKYIDNILKMDSNNAEAKKLKDNIAKLEKGQENNETKQTAQSAAVEQSSSNKNLTQEDAEAIVKNNFKYNSSEIVYCYDHDSEHDGKGFYVIHVYESHPTHTATLGWYGVEKSSGRIYDEMLNKYIN